MTESGSVKHVNPIDKAEVVAAALFDMKEEIAPFASNHSDFKIPAATTAAESAKPVPFPNQVLGPGR
jgi:hypothetical protein